MKVHPLVVDSIWGGAPLFPGRDPDHYRMCPVSGFLIARPAFEQEDAAGWGVDFVVPRRAGGNSHIINLRAVHREALTN